MIRSVRWAGAVILGLCALLISLTPRTLEAQRASVGVQLQSYRMSSAEAVHLEGISVTAVPWSVDVPLTEWVGISVDGAWARASATTPDGGKATVRGLTNTHSRLSLAWRRFVLTLSGTIPTGESTRALEEATVVGLMTSDLLPIGISGWESAGGLGADLAYGFRLGRTNVVVGAGYATSGEFAPLDGVVGPYAPGDRTHARVVVDTEFGTASILSFLMGVQAYGTDTFDSMELVSPGDRLETRFSLATPLGAQESMMLYAGLYHRAEGETGTHGGGQITPIETFIPGASVPVSRDLIVTGGELRVSRGRLDIIPAVGMRLLRSAEGLGQGWLTSLEGRAEYRVSGSRYGGGLVIQPGVAFRVGKLLPEAAAESMMVGWEAGVTGHWDFGR